MEQGGGGSIIGNLIFLVIIVVIIAAQWKIYAKAGKPGWAALVPIYNLIVLMDIVKRPGWWVLLMLIPLVNFVVFIIVAMDLAESFGKSRGWGFGMLFILGFIGYPILGFGDATYSPRAG